MMRLLPLGYDLSAPTYDALVGPSYAAQIGRLLDRVPLRPGAAILDVGCGTGVALFEAIRRVGQPAVAIGIDASPEMIRRARMKAAMAGVPAQFLAAPAERLPFPAAAFDLVISNSALHWFADRGGAVAEMARVLRPGGHLLLVAAVQPCCLEWLALVDAVSLRLLGRPQPPVLHLLPTADEIQRHLAAAGLLTLDFQARRWQEPVGEPARFMRAISTAMPTWQIGLSAAQIAHMEAALTDALRRLGPGWNVTWAAVEATATRPAVLAVPLTPIFSAPPLPSPGVVALPTAAKMPTSAALALAAAAAAPGPAAVWRPDARAKVGRVSVAVR